MSRTRVFTAHLCETHLSRINDDEYALSGRCRAYLWDRGPYDHYATDEPCSVHLVSFRWVRPDPAAVAGPASSMGAGETAPDEEPAIGG